MACRNQALQEGQNPPHHFAALSPLELAADKTRLLPPSSSPPACTSGLCPSTQSLKQQFLTLKLQFGAAKVGAA